MIELLSPEQQRAAQDLMMSRTMDLLVGLAQGDNPLDWTRAEDLKSGFCTASLEVIRALEALRRKAALAEVPVWKPEPGEILEGVIVGWREVDGPYGLQWQAVTQTVMDGRMSAVWLNPWLKDELKRLGARRGDLMSLSFLGRETSRRGSAYNRYTLAIVKPEEL